MSKRTIFIQSPFGEEFVPVSFYPGTSGEEIYRHIAQKLKLGSDSEYFLAEAEDAQNDEVVISASLPDGGRFKVKVVGDHAETASSIETPVINRENDFKRRNEVSDLRIEKIGALTPPACLLEEVPCSPEAFNTIKKARLEIHKILHGLDDRLVVIVGPCSIHDITAAKEYAQRLLGIRKELENELCIIMRVYFEKPRTTVGWKGLINDPDLNGTFHINKGLRVARLLLHDITSMGLPVGCEFLDTISPQFIADLVSWGAIGARTTECQLHRELASGLSMPVGFKNGTGGTVQMAVDAVVAAQCKHSFLSVSSQGLASIVHTAGNEDCHVILRGGSSGPNYTTEHVTKCADLMVKAGLRPNVMVDASHGNSRKNHENQPLVCEDIVSQLSAGTPVLCGVMIESHLKGGAQKLVTGQPLEYGKSITDACIDWDTTVSVLRSLAGGVIRRRDALKRLDA